MPGGEVELRGSGLLGAVLPRLTVGDTEAVLSLSRPERAVIQIPDGTTSGAVVLVRDGRASNALQLRVAVPMAAELHPVANPAVDAEGNVYATFSGARGESVPVSIYSIARDFEMRPFVRGILNATGLAFDADGTLYASSRAEGTVYRISRAGAVTTYAEGMGIATGIAFDREGNLFVGDRSGTIFKVGPEKGRTGGTLASGGQAGAEQTGGELADREIFVYATLEPSMAAYHLAFNDEGTLFVTGHHGLLSGTGTRAGHGLRRRRQPVCRRVAAWAAGNRTHHAAARSIARRLGEQSRRPRVSGRWLRRARHPRRPLPCCLGH
jgi:outer membrane protein assembly factor BamB